MFKKNVSVSQSSLLGGKDVKSLKTAVKKSCPAISDAQLSDLFPSKAKVTQAKLNNRAVVYGLEGGDPVFFDPTGHGDRVLPTVYTLARFPDALPRLHTYSEVSGKVLGGADLFLQGLLVPGGGQLPAFLANSAHALCVPGNPAPFAVGTMAVSRTEAERAGMKGRGLELMHCYGDLLWHMGDGAAPNQGFTPTRIFPLPNQDLSQMPAENSAAANLDGSGDNDDSSERPQQEPTPTGGGAAAASPPDVSGLSLDEAGAGAGLCPSLDELLESAVLGGLHSLKASELPILFSDFYSKHMLPHRPQGVTFDLKTSKYKKLSKLLDKFAKDKVLTQKMVRKQDTISAVARDHPAYTAWQPVTAEPTNQSGNTSTPAPGAAPDRNVLTVTPCFRVPTSLRPVFGPAAAADKERLYDGEEVAAALAAYAQQQGLARPGSSIALDGVLLSGLFGKKEEFSVGSTIPDRALLTKLKDKLQLYHRLERVTPQGPVVSVRKGMLPPISIAAVKRRGHPITTISHLESFGLSAEEMAKDFQKQFSSSCSVAELPGKQEHDMEISMQGDLGAKVAAFLATAHGIPNQFIEVKASKK